MDLANLEMTFVVNSQEAEARIDSLDKKLNRLSKAVSTVNKAGEIKGPVSGTAVKSIDAIDRSISNLGEHSTKSLSDVQHNLMKLTTATQGVLRASQKNAASMQSNIANYTSLSDRANKLGTSINRLKLMYDRQASIQRELNILARSSKTGIIAMTTARNGESAELIQQKEATLRLYNVLLKQRDLLDLTKNATKAYTRELINEKRETKALITDAKTLDKARSGELRAAGKYLRKDIRMSGVQTPAERDADITYKAEMSRSSQAMRLWDKQMRDYFKKLENRAKQLGAEMRRAIRMDDENFATSISAKTPNIRSDAQSKKTEADWESRLNADLKARRRFSDDWRKAQAQQLVYDQNMQNKALSEFRRSYSQSKKQQADHEKAIRTQIRETERLFQRRLQTMREWSIVLRQIGMTFMRYITAPLIAATAASVKYTAEIEMQQAAFGILLDSVEKGKQLYEEVIDYAAWTPYQLPDLTQATKELLAFGSAHGDVIHELQMLGDIAQNDAKKLESVVQAFGKVQARGKAHMRELNRFIMAGVPIFSELQKVMNLDPTSFIDAVRAGAVTFDAVKRAVENMTSEGGRFYDMSYKLSQTASGLWSTLKDEVLLAGRAFAEEFMPLIKDFLRNVISYARAVQNMTKAQKESILQWVKFGVVLGPALLAFSHLLNFSQALARVLPSIAIAAKTAFTGIGAGLAKIGIGTAVGGKVLTGAAVGGAVSGPVGWVLIGLTALLGIAGSVLWKRLQNHIKASIKGVQDLEAATKSWSDVTQSVEIRETFGTMWQDLTGREPRSFVSDIEIMEARRTGDWDRLLRMEQAYQHVWAQILDKQDKLTALQASKSESMLAKSAYARSAFPVFGRQQETGSAALEANIQALTDEISNLITSMESRVADAVGDKPILTRIAQMIIGATPEEEFKGATDMLAYYMATMEDTITDADSRLTKLLMDVPVSDLFTRQLRSVVDAGVKTEEAALRRLDSGLKELEGTEWYNLIMEAIFPQKEGFKQGAARDMAAFLEGFPALIISATKDFMTEMDIAFKQENIGTLFDPLLSLDPEVIKSKATGNIKDIEGLFSGIYAAYRRAGKTEEQAIKDIQRRFGAGSEFDLISMLADAKKTEEATSALIDLKKQITEYGDSVNNIGKSARTIFMDEVDSLLALALSIATTKEAKDDLASSAKTLKENYDKVNIATEKQTLAQNILQSALANTSLGYEIASIRMEGYTDEIENEIIALKRLAQAVNVLSNMQTAGDSKMFGGQKISDVMLALTTPYASLPAQYQNMFSASQYASMQRGAVRTGYQEYYSMPYAERQAMDQSSEFQRMQQVGVQTTGAKTWDIERQKGMTAAYKDMNAQLRLQLDTFGKSERAIDLLRAKQDLKNASDTEAKKQAQDNIDLLNKLTEREVMAQIGSDLLNQSMSGLIDSFKGMGEALANGEDGLKGFAQSFAQVITQIINSLPTLLLNASLLAFSNGRWELGAFLLATSAISAIAAPSLAQSISGVDDSPGNYAPSTITYSAKGNIYKTGNILSAPTMFKTNTGFGVAGEDGAEGILPLRRTAGGDLGVIATGTGAGSVTVPVTVNVINQTGVPVETETEETIGPDGERQIQLLIKRVVSDGMAKGEYDRVMGSRYGMKNRGVV